jgi:hypothetical protein
MATARVQPLTWQGLVPQSILTDDNGTGMRFMADISTVVTGSTFDIHFRIIDKTTSAIVLTSDCYVYTAR